MYIDGAVLVVTGLCFASSLPASRPSTAQKKNKNKNEKENSVLIFVNDCGYNYCATNR